MKTEILRCLRIPLYWLTLCMSFLARICFSYLDRVHRAADYWVLSLSFWNKNGSLTMAFMILVVLIRIFTFDCETSAQPLIASTRYGRSTLFIHRLSAGMCVVLLGTALIVYMNIGVSFAVGHCIARPDDWLASFLVLSYRAIAGTIGLYLASSCICDSFQNHPAAACICSALYLISYFINAKMILPFSPLWFFRYGFFTDLMRGNALTSHPTFWAFWYLILLLLVFGLATRQRKERKEL